MVKPIEFKKYTILIIIFINMVCYWNSLSGQFVWDDIVYQEFFSKNIKSFFDLFEIFKIPNPVGPKFYYRPFALLTYGLDYMIYGSNPIGYHLTALFFHLLNVVLVYLISERVIKDRWVSILSAILFSVHPVHSEAVSWISARMDLVATFFTLVSFYSYIKYIDNKRFSNLILTLIFFIFALFSKEISIILIFVYLCYPPFTGKRVMSKEVLLTFLFSSGIVAGYLLVRMSVVGTLVGDYYPLGVKVSTVPWVIISYFKLFFYPFDLRLLYDKPYLIKEPLNRITVLSWLGVGIFLLITFITYKRNSRLSFFLIFYLIFLLPVSGLITFIRISLIADRYLYLPSVGLVIFCSYLIVWMIGKVKSWYLKRLLIFGTVVILIVFSVITVIRNRDWNNQYDFLAKMINQKPDYYVAYVHLGHYYMDRGMFDKAEEMFLKAEKYTHFSEIYIIYNNLGVLYRKKGEYEKAFNYLIKAISEKRDYSVAYYNLSLLYFEAEDFENSLNAILEALKYDINSAEIYYIASLNAYYLGMFNKALTFIEKAIELDPKNEEYRINKSFFLKNH